MQAWQQSGGAIAAFGTVRNDHADQQPVAASGSGTGYINSCIRFDLESEHSAPQELGAAARSSNNPPSCGYIEQELCSASFSGGVAAGCNYVETELSGASYSTSRAARMDCSG
jgi:hypothetical protein